MDRQSLGGAPPPASRRRVARRVATLVMLAGCAACSGAGDHGLVSSDADRERCKQQSAREHELLRRVVEPLAELKSAADADYGDSCDSAFDGAYLSWDVPGARVARNPFQAEVARFVAAGWTHTDPKDTEIQLQPGDMLVERTVDGHHVDVLFSCENAGDGGFCSAWAEVDH